MWHVLTHIAVAATVHGKEIMNYHLHQSPIRLEDEDKELAKLYSRLKLGVLLLVLLAIAAVTIS